MEKESLPQNLATLYIETAPLMIRTVKSQIKAVAGAKLTHPQYRILSSIHRGLNTVGQLAIDHGVSQPAMSKNVDMLFKKKLIERKSHHGDRRQITLYLTASGLKTFQDMKKMAAKNFSRKLKSLSQLEQKKLLLALETLKQMTSQLGHSTANNESKS